MWVIAARGHPPKDGFQLRLALAGRQNSAEQDARDQQLRLNGRRCGRCQPGSVAGEELPPPGRGSRTTCSMSGRSRSDSPDRRESNGRARVRGRGRRRRRCDLKRLRSMSSCSAVAVEVQDRAECRRRDRQSEPGRRPEAPVAMWSETIMQAKPVGINHVALEVGNVEEALEFYGRIFELSLRGEPGVAFVDIGDQFVALAEGRRQALTTTATSASSSTTRSARSGRPAKREPTSEATGSETRGAITSRWSPTRTSSSRRHRRSSRAWASRGSRRPSRLARSCAPRALAEPRSAPGCPRTPRRRCRFSGALGRGSRHRTGSRPLDRATARAGRDARPG